VKVALDNLEAFEKVIKYYSRIGESLTRFGMLSSSFNVDDEF